MWFRARMLLVTPHTVRDSHATRQPHKNLNSAELEQSATSIVDRIECEKRLKIHDSAPTACSMPWAVPCACVGNRFVYSSTVSAWHVKNATQTIANAIKNRHTGRTFRTHKIAKHVQPNSGDNVVSVRLDTSLDSASSKPNATNGKMYSIVNRPLVCKANH